MKDFKSALFRLKKRSLSFSDYLVFTVEKAPVDSTKATFTKWEKLAIVVWKDFCYGESISVLFIHFVLQIFT